MEEEIQKIIKANWQFQSQKTAKEIASDFRKFIEWKDDKLFDYYRGTYGNETETGYKVFTLDELWDHWLTNVKDKE